MMPADPDHVARALLTGVGDAAVRAMVLAGVMSIAIVVLRRHRASARLAAWTMVLGAALALPVLGVVLPAWRWSVPTTQLLEAWAPATPASIGDQFLVSGGSAAPVAAPLRSWPPATVIAAAIYLAGVCLFSIYGALAWLAARRLRTRGRTITDGETLVRLDRHASTAGLARSPRLLESPHLFVPVTTSVLKPIVALPADWREWPAGKLDAVLIHEVAHVARRDALTQRLSLFYRAVFWFSPFSWWLHRRLADLADQASDEAALEAGIDPATYAGALLDFFGQLQRGPRRAEWYVAMARRADADAAQRVERILSWKGGPIMRRSKVLLAGFVLATVPVVAVTASVRVTADAGPSFTTARAAIDRAPGVAGPMAEPAAPAAIVAQMPAKSQAQSARPAAPAKSVADGLTELAAALDQAKRGPAPQEPPDDFAKGAYEADAPGVIAPNTLRSVKPRYTPDAMRAKIQGTVSIEIIILPDGTVGKARVKKSGVAWRPDGSSADPMAAAGQLIDQALIAARQWTFTPGTLNGQAVSIHTTLVLEFRLH